MGNALKLHTFCSLVFPKKDIWNRDIDKSVDSDILNILALKTATSYKTVFNTSLKAYEGSLFEKINPYGNTLWIMPLGIFHRTRRKFGLQLCTKCISEDTMPYYRRKWRLAFMTLCEIHKIHLIDKCPDCNEPIVFFRNELGKRHKLLSETITKCSKCNLEWGNIIGEQVKGISKIALNYQNYLISGLNESYFKLPNNEYIFSVLYFPVLHKIASMLNLGRKSNEMRKEICHEVGIDYFSPKSTENYLEHLSIEDRDKLFLLSCWFLDQWPERFIRICSKLNLLSSYLLKDIRKNPFWYWKVINENFYRPNYVPSFIEIENTISLLSKRGKNISLSSISEYMGKSDVFRKRILSTYLQDFKEHFSK